MRDSEVVARCQKKTETVCFVSGRRFKIADLGIGYTEIPYMQEMLHPDVSAGMSEEERQAAYAKIFPKEKAALEREREKFIAFDAAAERERESALAAERARAAREAAEQAALSPPPESP